MDAALKMHRRFQWRRTCWQKVIHRQLLFTAALFIVVLSLFKLMSNEDITDHPYNRDVSTKFQSDLPMEDMMTIGNGHLHHQTIDQPVLKITTTEDQREGLCNETLSKFLVAESKKWKTTEAINNFIAVGPGKCRGFRYHGKLVHGVTKNILKHHRPRKYELGNVMLMVQLSPDRLDRLAALASHWPGPISAAVYVKNYTDPEFLNAVCRITRKNIFIHVVHSVGEIYPTNTLRNVALSEVYTEFAFLTDVDFMPHYGLYDYLVNFIRKDSTPLLHKSTAFVVPAFEMKSNYTKFPKNKTELIQLWDKEEVMQFHYLSKCTECHQPTNYTHWRNASSMYKVDYIGHLYEPYIIARTCSLPRYYTTFVGRNYNKVSQLYELHHAGYKFWVLPDVFTIHQPHSEQQKGVGNVDCANHYFWKWKKVIEEMYKGRAPIDHTCDGHIAK